MAQWKRICLLMQEMQGTWVQSLSQEDLLEKKKATCSSILAWKIPWTEKPGGLQSMGSQQSQTQLNTHALLLLLLLLCFVIPILKQMEGVLLWGMRCLDRQ